MEEQSEDGDAVWRVGVFDAHCHPTDIMASINDISRMNARILTVMATRSQDQHLVADAAQRYPLVSPSDCDNTSTKHVVPAFGWHPWFSHQMLDDRDLNHTKERAEHYKAVLTPSPDDEYFLSSLAQPLSLSQYLKETEERLRRFPLALIGEVGLDRSFRLPYGGFIPAGDISAKTGGSEERHTPGSREGRPLTPYRVSLEHQKTILRAQFELAGKMGRAVSVHSVQTHGVVFELLQSMWKGHERPSKRQKKGRKSASQARVHENEDNPSSTSLTEQLPYPPRICMHSYSGPPEALTQFLAPTVPAEIYFSFSIVINFSTPAQAKAVNVIKAVSDDRILVESDLHCAGERMDGLLRDIVLKICEIKQWKPNEGAQQLKKNWIRFAFGPEAG